MKTTLKTLLSLAGFAVASAAFATPIISDAGDSCTSANYGGDDRGLAGLGLSRRKNAK